MSRTQAVVFRYVVGGGPGAVQAQSSLAEAAQKEAARRKEVKGIARVITNKDLPNVPPATAAAPASGRHGGAGRQRCGSGSRPSERRSGIKRRCSRGQAG